MVVWVIFLITVAEYVKKAILGAMLSFGSGFYGTLCIIVGNTGYSPW